MKHFVKLIAGSLWVLPVLAFAQTIDPDLGYFTKFFDGAKKALDSAVIALIALAVCWFIWNVIRFAIAQDEDKKSEAKHQMLMGIIALGVIVSMWALVAILQNIFGVGNKSISDVGNIQGLIP